MELNNKLPQLEEIQSCPVCHSSSQLPWSEAHDLLTQLSNQYFVYSICGECRVLYMSRRPVEGDISFFYRGDYHPYQSENKIKRIKESIFSKLKKWMNRSVFFLNPNLNIRRQYQKHYHQNGQGLNFLDFGCGAGKQLNHLKKFQWNTVGVDFSPIAVETAIRNGHQGYLVPDFSQSGIHDFFDLVRMNHVVEHLYHPHEVLSGVANKMKKGSTLHIAVPNPAGISAKIFKSNWHGLDCPRHVILYSPKAMIDLLQANGFNNCIVLQETITKDFVRSLGYLMAQYGMVDLSKVQNMMNSKFLSAIFFLPILLTSKIGYGDRYHVFCERE
jgi:2-polyprenyl-3-methyl-5-hydroxy-6-metoxy-1,4-benzoquinol methylase